MQTLREFLKDKPVGYKFIEEDYNHHKYLKLTAVGEHNALITGELVTGRCEEFCIDLNEGGYWEEYVEPKKKRVLYPVLMKSKYGNYYYWISPHLFETIREAQNANLTLELEKCEIVRLLTEMPVEVWE